ncbi:MAG: response regulator [Anaerolineae bacterium]|jgi:two-component system NtrC family sensor kinase
MAGETILIVDDNREIVSALTDILVSKGYGVLSAHNGRQGLWLALERNPDLILLDWNLPQLSGYQVLQALRERGSTAPVVLMTMYGSENVAVQAFRLGVRDYIPKPFRVPDTLGAIEQALAEERLRQEKEQIAGQLEQANRQMEQQLLEMTTLQAIGQSLTSTLNLEEVLSRVVEAACYFTDARESSLLLLDKEEDALITRAYHGVDRREPTRLRLKFSTSPLRQAIETGEPLFLTSGTADYSIKLRTGYLVRSLLYVPLYIQEQPLGLLGVTDKVGAQAFVQDDARLLSSLASYAVVAIENARLYESEKELARTETVKQMIVTLSHYIKNPLTAITLSTYDLSMRQSQGQATVEDDTLQRNVQMIEMNVREITAVIAILQQLASPKATVYVNGIQMIDIEDQVREQVQKIRHEYPEIDALLGQSH